MQKRLVVLVTTAFAALVFTNAIYAMSLFSHHSSSEKSTTIDVLYPAKLGNGPMLKPGTYRLKVALNSPRPQVQFYQHGKLVAHATAKTVQDPSKNNYTAVEYNQKGKTHVITKIDLRGVNESLAFAGASGGSNSGT